MPQFNFFLDDDGNEIVDEILRFENFESDLRVILEKVGFGGVSIPHENKSAIKPYRHYYNKKTARIVGKIYKKDIELLGYEY